ncbi:class II fructose-bisphosphate aldolase [Candidatus Kaiserbacteria bacterium]|nr:class II fructose-bisphosphate aldolase [Candidatus Kaiserbacteria bacterium]
MRTLKEATEWARGRGIALGHFNISDSNQLKAVAEAARETQLPVIVGLSEGEREYFPIAHARSLIDLYRKDGVELFLNADHTYSIEKVRAAVDDGVDSVVVDGAKLSFEKNVAYTREAIAYARAASASRRSEVVIEGELGYIGSSSTVLDALPEGAQVTEELMTKPEEAAQFVRDTGADCLAPAVGNVHGIVKGGDPKLSISRIKEIADAAGVPIVLHGGSGNKPEEFTEAIRSGIAIVHINTELRLAYRNALEKTLAEKPDEVAPYKFLAPSVEAMKDFLVAKIRLFAME